MLLVGISYTPEETRRDGWRAWLSVAAVSFSGTVFCTTEFLPVGLIRYVSADLGVSEGTTGLMVTAPGLMAAIAGPVVALFSGKTDRRAIMLLLSLLLICANVMAAFATRFEIVVIARMLFGIGLGGFWAIGTGIASRLVSPAAVGKATSIIFTSISIGLLIGGPAGTFVSEIVGWRYAFGLTAIVSVLSFFTLMFSLPSLKVNRSVSVNDFLAILKSRNGKVGMVAMFLVVTGHFSAYTYITPFLASVPGFSGNTIALILLIYTLLGMVGNFAAGMTTDRYLSSTLVVGISLLAVSAGMLPIFGSLSPIAIALLGAWGIAYGIVPLAIQQWMVRAAPEAHEGGTALFVTNFQTSIATGSLLGGILVDTFGTSSALTLGGCCAVLSVAALLLFKKPWPSREPRLYLPTGGDTP